MKRFENAQVGDEVYCRLYGCGEIEGIDKTYFPITVRFENLSFDYTTEGFFNESHIEPTLFYRSGDNLYLTERPEPETDWTKVPRGIWIKCWDVIGAEKRYQFYSYDQDMTRPFIVMEHSGYLVGYKNAELTQEAE